MIIKTFLVTSMIGLIILFTGCDILIVSEVNIAPSQNNMISTKTVSDADWENSLALFKSIAKNNDYSFQESSDRKGGSLYIADGGNFYGPMMTLSKNQSVMIVAVSQYAGLAPYQDYKNLKKQVFKVFSESFGKDRVTMKEIN